jgi:hypothetical protein
MKTIFALALLFLTSVAHAQELTIGSLYPTFGTSYSLAGPLTMVNLSAPATGVGVVSTVTLTWRLNNGVVCPDAFRVRFFRKAADANVYVASATRGPFAGKEGQITVSLSPPVTVSTGDVIGVVQGPGGTCGTVVTARGGKTLRTGFVQGDSETFDLRSATLLENAVNIRASVSGRVYEGSIAAAGSLAGANGSFFRTSLHLTNLNDTMPLAGEVVFRAAGRAPSPGDPKLSFTIPPRNVVFWEDVVAAMGQSGLGSIDLYSLSSFPPVVNVRVFDDKGAVAGTSGFSEEFTPPAKTLIRGSAALALTPGNYRTNIGMRAIIGVAKVQFSLYNAQGVLIGSQIRDLEPGVFQQVPLTSLFGTAAANGAHVSVSLLSGAPVIVYASTTDNRTNDSSIQFARMAGD